MEDRVKLGTTHAYQVLNNLIKQNKFPQNILLTGSENVNKLQLTKYYLQEVFCEHKQNQHPCGTCQSCLLIDQKKHPDITWYEVDAKLGKEEISSIQSRMSESGLIGKSRAYVIEGLDTMTSQAQNAWLKFLEEPLPNVYCVAWIENENQMLATVKSRFLSLHAVSNDSSDMKVEIPAVFETVAKSFIERCEAKKNEVDLLLFLENNLKISEDFQVFLEALLHQIVLTNCGIHLIPLVSKVEKMILANVPQDQLAVYFCLNAYCEENNDEYDVKS